MHKEVLHVVVRAHNVAQPVCQLASAHHAFGSAPQSHKLLAEPKSAEVAALLAEPKSTEVAVLLSTELSCHS